ncbi:MAG: ATP-binding protein [Desulfobacterales bacterium]|nr:ATP-binding protein [Desulfobacterales bacterium]
MKKLPLGVQALETFRRDNCLYVDKTEHVFRMTDQGMFYFLARPRRFGKSLLVSVLKCLFQGKKELFEGLWIAEPGRWEWKEHPVVIIDFNGISHDTPENLQSGLGMCLEDTARNYDVEIKKSLLKEKFRELVLGLREKTEIPIVILVDEYDKPIIDHLGKGEDALEIVRSNRDILKNFFGVLKDTTVSPLLRFVFITGVSKFSRVSIFSELNNLNDITMNPHYADMLGYTQEELETCFKKYIELFAEATGFSREEIKSELMRRYNGYRFSKKNARVYNPFSVLKTFAESDFGNWWFETGTPAFLLNLLREKEYDLPQIENLEVAEEVFSTYDIDCLKPEALLFQTGYVTIKDVQDRLYVLGYPNEEVKNAFLRFLLFSFARDVSGPESSKFIRLSKYLREENFDEFFETVTAIFGSIPYTLNSKRDEAYFHTLFYLMVSASGADVNTEILTCRGRIDLVAECDDKVYIMEFKCNQSADTAIKQIHEKGYAERYTQTRKKIILAGINFSTEKRNLAEWKTESG